MLQAVRAVLVMASLLPCAAAAHEFTLFYLVPPSLTEAEQKEIISAFQIASHERDVHPDETSDGHLGGVDVRLSVMAISADTVIMGLQPDIVALPTVWPEQQSSLDRFSGAIVALPPSDAQTKAYLSQPGAAGLPGFVAAYASEVGHEPGPWGRASYAMARLIDEVVREFDGVEPAQAVQAAFDAHQTP